MKKQSWFPSLGELSCFLPPRHPRPGVNARYTSQPRIARDDDPGHFIVRRVSRCGPIQVSRNQTFVTRVPDE
jgi:hypothetical protein